jgi:hypothetical protein
VGKTKEPIFACSFCGKDRREVQKLISGPLVFICDECVVLCVEILTSDTHGIAHLRPLGESVNLLVALTKERDEAVRAASAVEPLLLRNAMKRAAGILADALASSLAVPETRSPEPTQPPAPPADTPAR